MLGIAAGALFLAMPAAVHAEPEMSFEEALFVDGEESIALDFDAGRWSVTTGESHDGKAAVVGRGRPGAGSCSDGYSSPYMYVTVPGRGTLSFWWKAKGGASGSVYGRDENFCSYQEQASISTSAEFKPGTYEIIYRDSEWVRVSLDCRLDEGDEYRIKVSASEDDEWLLLDEMSWVPASPATV